MKKKDKTMFEDFISGLKALNEDFHKERESKFVDFFIKSIKVVRNSYIILISLIVIPVTHLLYFLFPFFRERVDDEGSR